jgi:hypothetical protein
VAKARDYKREYWRPKALALIREIQFPLMYRIPNRDITDLGEEYGWDRLTKALRIKQQMEDLYWDNDRDKAHRLWLKRDADFPEWFWWYHIYNA